MNEKNFSRTFIRLIDDDFDRLTRTKCGYQFYCEYEEDDGLIAYFSFKVGFINLSEENEVTLVDDGILEGTMKFDGCLNLKDCHICGPVILDFYTDNLKYLYDSVAVEIFGKKSF